MINYIKGNIFKGHEDVLIHGCNCFHTMGKGIALQVKKLYPEAYEADKKTTYGVENKLGSFSFWYGQHKYYAPKSIIIVNAYTQFFYNAYRPFSYKALSEVLPKIFHTFTIQSIAMPKIGTGLAGGNWERISDIINECSKNRDIKIYIL